jgi:murein DD-endopeptidase MepM/ murein hydrolase activator NlpD
MTTMAVVTLMTTPAGELIGRGTRWLLGIKGRQTELIAYFGNAGKPAPTAFTAPEPTSMVAIVARAYGSSPSVLQGFRAASAVDPAKADAMDLTASGRELLRARGSSEVDLATAEGRLRAVSQAISDLTRDLGSVDAALAALVVGLAPVQYAVERVRAERSDLSLEAIATHLAPAARASAVQVVGFALKLATAYDLAWPVPRDTRIGSRFGMRVDPINGTQSLHNGVDLSVGTGTPIAATGDGTIVRSGEDGLNGKFLVIGHGRGVTTGYCHNSELLVERGARVSRGAIITHSGNTGRSTGPHLHYTLAIDGRAYDPLVFLCDSDRTALAVNSPKVEAPVPPRPPVVVHPADAGVAPKRLEAAAKKLDAGRAGWDAGALEPGPDAAAPEDAQAPAPPEPPVRPPPAEPTAADAGP